MDGELGNQRPIDTSLSSENTLINPCTDVEKEINECMHRARKKLKDVVGKNVNKNIEKARE